MIKSTVSGAGARLPEPFDATRVIECLFLENIFLASKFCFINDNEPRRAYFIVLKHIWEGGGWGRGEETSWEIHL